MEENLLKVKKSNAMREALHYDVSNKERGQ